MKIVLIVSLILLSTISCRSKASSTSSSKNKQFYSTSVFSRSPISRPMIYSSSNISRQWIYPKTFIPSFRWRWLYGIPKYNIVYIRNSRRSCSSICESVSSCAVSVPKPTHTGQLKCSCSESDTEEIVSSYCWTPRACIKAIGGCEVIYNRLKSKIFELKRR